VGLFRIVADVEDGVEVEAGRTLHQDGRGELAHEELLAVVRVRYEDHLSVVAHRADDRDVVVVVVTGGGGRLGALAAVLVERLSGNAPVRIGGNLGVSL
jgi:cell division ATPase FtsA